LPNDRENLGDIQLFVKPIEPPAEVARFLRAFFLAPLLSPLMLAFPPAAAVLFSDPGLIWYWLIGVLAINWGILAAVHYNDRLTALQNLLKEGFFGRWNAGSMCQGFFFTHHPKGCRPDGPGVCRRSGALNLI
jgi:hypothetical protein